MFNSSKYVKRFVSISAAAACILSSLRIAPISISDAATDKTMTAFEITENMKVGWNLGNTLDAYAQEPDANNPKVYVPVKSAGLETETCWGCPEANETLFKSIKAKGFNTVRIPTTWFQHLDENDNIDPAWMARVHQVVDYAYKNGMYVILNVHHEEGWINRPDLATAYDEINPRLMKIWTQIATEFKDYDQHLIFECMNEPRAKGTDWEWWSATPVEEADVINKLEANFVKLIRGMDGPYAKTRLLMLPGYVASSDKTFLNQIVLPENDDFLAVSIHAYTPYNFTMNTDEKSGAYHDTFTKEFSNDLAYNLQNFRDMFVDKGVPVVIGEMGTSDFGNTQARVEWTTQYFETTKKYGIPCVLWDNGQKKDASDPTQNPGEVHGYIDRKTGEWFENNLPIINKMMEIMNDKTIVWGSEAKIPTFDHQDLSTGKVFLENAEIDVAKEKEYGNSTPGKEISWDDLKGKEVAIKYTGDQPILAVSDKDYKGWSEMAAYTVDAENGIAYYLVDKQVPAAYSGDLSTINHMQARTPGKTNIEKIVILDAPDVDIEVEVDKTKKKTIDLSNAKSDDTLVITIKGEPNTDTNGAIGYNGEGWQEIKWEGKTDAKGLLSVEVPMSKFPAGLASAEAQIWYQAELVDFEGISFVNTAATTTTVTSITTSVATTTTTTTATKPASDTTTTSTTTKNNQSSTTTTATTTTTTQPNTKGGNGDANQDGQVDMADVVTIMLSLANPNKYALSDEAKAAADVYENNGVTTQDALAIQMYLLKVVPALPVPAGTVVG